MNGVGKTLTIAFATVAIGAQPSPPGPAKFEKMVRGTGKVRLTGWARVRGEIMLYPTPEAMKTRRKFPDCISGVPPNMADTNRLVFDSRRVVVSGTLVDYDSLPDEDSPAIPRKVLSGTIIINWCFGKNVLLINSVRLADKAGWSINYDRLGGIAKPILGSHRILKNSAQARGR